jgi:hypothetical protein
MSPRRYTVLPDRGTLLVFTDLHGNAADLAAAERAFARQRRQDSQTHVVFLGDLVHGPNLRTKEDFPEYDYEDRSWEVVSGVARLLAEHPDHAHLVLGNHDWGHVGGPHTCRFHLDEVSFMELLMDEGQRTTLHGLFEAAPLMLLAPCGVLLSHGSPDNSLTDLDQLEGLDLRLSANTPAGAQVLQSILTSYGQQPDVTDRLLDTLSRELGLDLNVVVHGHDRDTNGWYAEHHNQLQTVIFGAPDKNKRYLKLDLSARYSNVKDFKEGNEILYLHPEAGTPS